MAKGIAASLLLCVGAAGAAPAIQVSTADMFSRPIRSAQEMRLLVAAKGAELKAAAAKAAKGSRAAADALEAPDAFTPPQPPQLVSLAIVATTVNVATAGRFRTRLRWTDDRSGVRFSCHSYQSPTGGYRGICVDATTFSTDSNLVYESFELPTYTESGTWTLHDANACDRGGNCRYYGPADLDAIKAARNVTVSNVAARSDTAPPSVTAASVTPTAPISKPDLSVNLTLQDNLSGVNYVYVCGNSLTHGFSACYDWSLPSRVTTATATPFTLPWPASAYNAGEDADQIEIYDIFVCEASTHCTEYWSGNDSDGNGVNDAAQLFGGNNVITLQ